MGKRNTTAGFAFGKPGGVTVRFTLAKGGCCRWSCMLLPDEGGGKASTSKRLNDEVSVSV
jgi:hypothetical protein